VCSPGWVAGSTNGTGFKSSNSSGEVIFNEENAGEHAGGIALVDPVSRRFFMPTMHFARMAERFGTGGGCDLPKSPAMM